MKNWVVNPHCPQMWLSSCLGERLLSRGDSPKVWSSTDQPQSRQEGPDLVSHPCRWICVEMLKIPHRYCWKMLMPCGWMTIFSHVIHESLSESKALCLACWQAAAFWLPLTQHETAGCWAPPPTIPRLHLENYMPSPTSPNLWIMRGQKTLALARVLKAHTKESGCPTRVLYEVTWELQQCMAPLLVPKGDKIAEASLLKSVEGECRSFPIPEDEATLLSDNKPDIEMPQVPEQPEISEQVQPVE